MTRRRRSQQDIGLFSVGCLFTRSLNLVASPGCTYIEYARTARMDSLTGDLSRTIENCESVCVASGGRKMIPILTSRLPYHGTYGDVEHSVVS